MEDDSKHRMISSSKINDVLNFNNARQLHMTMASAAVLYVFSGHVIYNTHTMASAANLHQKHSTCNSFSMDISMVILNAVSRSNLSILK